MKKLALTLAFLLALGAPAYAQSASHTRAADELLTVMDLERATREGMELMLRQQIAQNPEMARFEDIMREFMGKAMNWTEMKPEYARLYAEVFTEAELREMIAFYQTPLGRRMLQTMPQLMVRSAEISQRRVQEHVPEMTRRMMERMSQPGTSSPKP